MRFLLSKSPYVFVLLCPCMVAVAQQADYTPLFDGASLSGWVQRGGHARYEVIDGTIVGTTVANSPNSFLCTTRDYGDFALDLELKVDSELNSGIQIRSHHAVKPKTIEVVQADGEKNSIEIPAGHVFGYQVEVDPSDRAYSGGIYDESRRGWLFDLAGDHRQDARQAFRRDEWNHYRIEAIGSSIKTWVNGVPVSDLIDEMDESGFIALQVHSVDHDRPLQVRWRNIRIKELNASQVPQ